MTLPQKARHTHLPIWCDATRLLVETENAVRKFPRYHKYAVGAELRRQAMNLCRSIVRAAARGHAAAELDRLVFAVEDTSIQLAKELKAFVSFAEFARAARHENRSISTMATRTTAMLSRFASCGPESGFFIGISVMGLPQRARHSAEQPVSVGAGLPALS